MISRFASCWTLLVVLVAGLVSADPLRIGTFDIDVTPPIGSRMAYDPVTNGWELGLRARGVVVWSQGRSTGAHPGRVLTRAKA